MPKRIDSKRTSLPNGRELVDGFNYHEVNFNLKCVTVAQLIVSNARKRAKIKKDQNLVRYFFTEVWR